MVTNIVTSMAKAAPAITFDLTLPAGQGYDQWCSSDNLVMHMIPYPSNRLFGRLVDIHWRVAQWCREFESDICFTLGDIGPIRLPIPHVVLLQQAMITYRDPVFEKFWTSVERWKFRYTRWHFGRMAPHCAAITVQTPVMAERVQQSYNIPMDKIRVVSSALPAHLQQALTSSEIHPNTQIMAVNKPCRLLFLAAGYEHKNHCLLPALAETLRQRGLADKVHLFVTLDPTARSYERDLLTHLEPYADCVTNLGRLPPDQVAGAYQAASALFMPTLVESFGLIYLEAMAYGCPILTSDRDFARWMCGDLARYFEPTSVASMADAVERFVTEGPPSQDTESAAQRLADFPTSWEPVARQYVEILRQCVA